MFFVPVDNIFHGPDGGIFELVAELLDYGAEFVVCLMLVYYR
jgi:hypothetical protein